MKRRLFAVAVFFGIGNVAVAQEEVTLERAVMLALEKNYDIQIAKNTKEVTQTDKDYSWGGYLPQINGSASTLHSENDQDLRFSDETRNNAGTAEANNVTASV